LLIHDRFGSLIGSRALDEPHHRCAKLTIAIATLQSAAAAELVIMDLNWRNRAFVTSVAS